MTTVTYKIVEHDGGWAYQVGDTFSETYLTHDIAKAMAQEAAREQTQPGEDAGISYDDKAGQWHEEAVSGEDRPQTKVEG
jgi:hypothetical protein